METYEEKYKMALERASKLRVQNPFDTVSQMMEHVFPELKEVKEEKVDNQKMINKIIKEVADLVKVRTDFSAKEVADLVSENIIFIKKEVLTSDEAARYLGMSKSYLYKLTMKKEIPHYKPLGKMCYFNRQELEAWLQSNRVAMDVKHLTK